jgi:hypothetical protein
VTNTWDARARISAYASVLLAVLVLLLTLQWNSYLVVAAGALSVVLASLSLRDGLPAGSCPTCRARPRRQDRQEIAASVVQQAEGWLVTLTVERLCTNCRESRRLAEEIPIPRDAASTEAAALVLARSGRYAADRIRLTN